jgi:hypothetical protein
MLGTPETTEVAAAVAKACIQNFHEKPDEFPCFDCHAALDIAAVKVCVCVRRSLGAGV